MPSYSKQFSSLPPYALADVPKIKAELIEKGVDGRLSPKNDSAATHSSGGFPSFESRLPSGRSGASGSTWIRSKKCCL
jgi:hypothetical protein